MQHHLAQVNIARTRHATGAAAMADFVARIDEMNRLAEGSKGFVWRMRGADVTPEMLRVFENYFVPFEPERFFYNLSVWESVEDLHRYVFHTTHVELFRGKHRWMETFDRAHLALWWIAAGHRPTVAESAERLRAVDEKGGTSFAFTWKMVFPAPGAEKTVE
jgi:hypothetical protein